jgi:hypothetical protein
MSIESDVALSIHSYYSNETATGLRACERLMRDSNDHDVRSVAMRNRLFYIKPLHETLPTTYEKVKTLPIDEKWKCTNPCILKVPDGYLVNVRNVNYNIVNGRYIMNDPKNVVRTKNILVKMDKEFKILNETVLQDPEYNRTDFPVDSIEDSRIFNVEDKLFASSTLRNHAEYNGAAIIVTTQIVNGAHQDLTPVRCTGMNNYEKNWMPVIGDGKKWLYICGPDTKVVSVTSDVVSLTKVGDASRITEPFRGSSQVIPFGTGYLSCIHEVAYSGDSRIYSHRFIIHKSDLSIEQLSIPFYVKEKLTIEFVAGLALSHDLSEIILSFGLRDAEAWFARIQVQDFHKLF